MLSRVVQLDVTPENEVLCMLIKRSSSLFLPRHLSNSINDTKISGVTCNWSTLYRVAAKGLPQKMEWWAEWAVQACTALLAHYSISRVELFSATLYKRHLFNSSRQINLSINVITLTLQPAWVRAVEPDDGAPHLLHGPHSPRDERVGAAGPHAPRELPVPRAQLAHGVVVGRRGLPAVLQTVGI